MKNGTTKRIFAQKRAQLAKLPFEKKIEIVIKLQKMASGIGRNAKKPIWPI